jgi:hypothetical protein
MSFLQFFIKINNIQMITEFINAGTFFHIPERTLDNTLLTFDLPKVIEKNQAGKNLENKRSQCNYFTQKFLYENSTCWNMKSLK